MARGVRGGVFFKCEASAANVSFSIFSEGIETQGGFSWSWSGGEGTGEFKAGRHGLEK